MRKPLLIFIFLGGLALGYALFNMPLLKPEPDRAFMASSVSANPASSSKSSSLEQTLALEPASFSIPSLGLTNIKVESVGLDDENKMDIPRDENNVAWYNLGSKPGELGNAVIAGHYDKKSGAPAVFFDINKLKSGDELIVTDRAGKQLRFKVTEVKSYQLEDFPLDEVFGLGNKPRLNLITCEGQFDTSSRLYSHRLVVYSELKSD